MNDLEAIKALIEGKKIRRSTWREDRYYIHILDNKLVFHDGSTGVVVGYEDKWPSTWEIYEEPKTLKQEYEELEKDREKYNRCSMWHAQELEKLIKKEIARQEAKK